VTYSLREDRAARVSKYHRRLRLSLRAGGRVVADSGPVRFSTITVLLNPWWSLWEDASLHLTHRGKRCQSFDPVAAPGREGSDGRNVRAGDEDVRPVFDGLPNMLGPWPATGEAGKRALVVMFAGEKGQENVDAVVRRFGLRHFSYMLFVYDRSDWSGFDWAADPGVTLMYKARQMKWWYVKQWLHPEAVAGFEALLVVDEDCNVADFDPLLFLDVMQRYRVSTLDPGVPHRMKSAFRHRSPWVRRRSGSRSPPSISGRFP
jgi:hypothetical protein